MQAARSEPSPDAVAAALLSFVACCGAQGRNAVYVSAPITTGRAFLDWRRTHEPDFDESHPEYAERHRAQVVARNVAHARETVSAARARFPELVVDPTRLDDVPGWVQADYHAFWAAVVERHAKAVVFVEGWEFSTGCVVEFLTALRSGAALLDEHLEPFAPAEGVSRLRTAMAELEAVGVDASALAAALADADAMLAARSDATA